jgi:hypothetical protein
MGHGRMQRLTKVESRCFRFDRVGLGHTNLVAATSAVAIAVSEGELSTSDASAVSNVIANVGPSEAQRTN